MLSASFFVAASSIASLALGAPIVLRRADQGAAYQVFGGDGTKGQGWPASSQWLSFSELWDLNLPTISSSCAQFKMEENGQEINGWIKNALQASAKKINADPSFLLAVMMQESKGCARAPTTNYGEENPGLFQSFNGKKTCSPADPHFTKCDQQTVEGMVDEGAGLNADFGLQQAMAQSGASDDSKYYKGARIYNSGSLPASGNLGDGIATHCYASDIANRLVGWVSSASTCEEASIGSVQGSATAYSGGNTGNTGNTDNNENNNNNNNNPEPEPQPQPQPNEANTQNPPENEPEPTETPAPGNNDSDAPKIQGANANCKSWYTVKEGDDCSKLSVSFETLRSLNSQLDDKCSNLWKGYAYCVAA